MPGQVFYRKWRPQRFSDVVGQEYATKTLLNALATGQVAHAYLLCGPRGTGKTSTGRIMAKALNCLKNGGKGEPCNECAMCEAITEGRAIDLIEIDAASNRGIDEMRSLREKVNYAPTEARYKVYIIDEVHMLTEPAFNALLKTLEEPPPHTVFILATTDPQKLPPTVISRCQRFDFRRISLKDVTDRLEKLSHDEDIKAAPEVLMAVARSAGGSLRDAENIFEQLVVGYGRNLEMGQLRDFLGLGGEKQVRAVAAAALSGDIASGLRAITSASAEGLDPRQFHRQVLEYLRVLLLVKSGVDDALEQFPDAREELLGLARSSTPEQVLRAVKLFSDADLRTSAYSTLPLEIALVETASGSPKSSGASDRDVAPAPRVSESNVVASQPQPRVEVPRPAPAPAASAPPARVNPPAPPMETPKPSVQPIAKVSAAAPPAASANHDVPPTPPAAPSAPTSAMKVPAGNEADLMTLIESWPSVIEASRAPGQKIKIDALLRAGEPVEVKPDEVVLAFPYEKFVDMMRQELENPGSRRALEEALAGVLGRRRPVRCIVQAKKRTGGHLLKAAVEMGARVVDEGPPSGARP